MFRQHDGRREPLPATRTGSVDPDNLYRLDEVKVRMGWKASAFRAAVRAGLNIYRSGKRVYVLGSDLITFVTKGEVER